MPFQQIHIFLQQKIIKVINMKKKYSLNSMTFAMQIELSIW